MLTFPFSETNFLSAFCAMLWFNTEQRKERKILNARAHNECSTCKNDYVHMSAWYSLVWIAHIGHVAHFEAVEHVSGFLLRFTCSLIHSFFSLLYLQTNIVVTFFCLFLAWQHYNFRAQKHIEHTCIFMVYWTTFLGSSGNIYIYNKFMHIHPAHYHRYYHRGSLVFFVCRFFYSFIFFIFISGDVYAIALYSTR